MLEAKTHNYLKEFLKKNPTNWNHLYSFGRITATFVRKRSNLLINSEIFSTQEWFPGILISLFLNQVNSKIVVPGYQFQFLLNEHLPLYKELGFEFSVKNNQIIFAQHKIFIHSTKSLLNDYKNSNFEEQIIIFADLGSFKKDLKNILRITLHKKDWFNDFDSFLGVKNELAKTYDLLKEKFFLRSFPGQKLMSLDFDDANFLKKVIKENVNHSDKFIKLNKAITSGWAFWINLDQNNFEWSLEVEPIDQFDEINELLRTNNMIFLSSLRRDNFFKRYLTKHDINLTSSISFESSFIEKNIFIYVPSKLLLPNNPSFTNSTIDKCKKLSFLSKGISIFLSNEDSFKIKLATQLASIYGQRVLLENYPKLDNQIVCSSYDWWIDNLHLICPPDQIIISLLPFPDMVQPINQETILYLRSKSNDWFREFMFPESFDAIDKAISPLRKNSGKLVFLDGRISNRKWGRDMLDMIQPQKVLTYMYPFE
tara:strand:+ start:1038 stop:2486 length:1449 start_codon:yes stop_codon:yes gene_type:complete